jgi:hypothetical protein
VASLSILNIDATGSANARPELLRNTRLDSTQFMSIALAHTNPILRYYFTGRQTDNLFLFPTNLLDIVGRLCAIARWLQGNQGTFRQLFN